MLTTGTPRAAAAGPVPSASAAPRPLAPVASSAEAATGCLPRLFARAAARSGAPRSATVSTSTFATASASVSGSASATASATATTRSPSSALGSGRRLALRLGFVGPPRGLDTQAWVERLLREGRHRQAAAALVQAALGPRSEAGRCAQLLGWLVAQATPLPRAKSPALSDPAAGRSSAEGKEARAAASSGPIPLASAAPAATATAASARPAFLPATAWQSLCRAVGAELARWLVSGFSLTRRSLALALLERAHALPDFPALPPPGAAGAAWALHLPWLDAVLASLPQERHRTTGERPRVAVRLTRLSEFPQDVAVDRTAATVLSEGPLLTWRLASHRTLIDLMDHLGDSPVMQALVRRWAWQFAQAEGGVRVASRYFGRLLVAEAVAGTTGPTLAALAEAMDLGLRDHVRPGFGVQRPRFELSLQHALLHSRPFCSPQLWPALLPCMGDLRGLVEPLTHRFVGRTEALAWSQSVASLDMGFALGVHERIAQRTADATVLARAFAEVHARRWPRPAPTLFEAGRAAALSGRLAPLQALPLPKRRAQAHLLGVSQPRRELLHILERFAREIGGWLEAPGQASGLPAEILLADYLGPEEKKALYIAWFQGAVVRLDGPALAGTREALVNALRVSAESDALGARSPRSPGARLIDRTLALATFYAAYGDALRPAIEFLESQRGASRPQRGEAVLASGLLGPHLARHLRMVMAEQLWLREEPATPAGAVINKTLAMISLEQVEARLFTALADHWPWARVQASLADDGPATGRGPRSSGSPASPARW